MSTNGTHPEAEPISGEAALASLRQRPHNPHAFGGYGPLIALGVLLLLMVVFAPTVAPEEIVLKPKDAAETTTTLPPDTTTTAAPTGSGVTP